MRLSVVPITLREASAFVGWHHRHHRPPQGGLFAVGAAAKGQDGGWQLGWQLEDDLTIVAVAIVGNPVARRIDDGWTVEVTRLAALPGHPNACSMLYAAAWRAARALGYRRAVTYTLASEPGTSVLAAGWRCIGKAGGGTWSRKSRPRVDLHPTQTKIRWEATL